ncbi:hypothetical protein CEXT_206851 [Caerostris extrusa]|uniref:Uncharacterized protein n=1 Tax=Caerostris extrusa TaxID=172846 RepID=A0AAV4R8R1_CAEEX|nr:hypothetical protein CEXT_206851 [Caerostris extrusa]
MVKSPPTLLELAPRIYYSTMHPLDQMGKVLKKNQQTTMLLKNNQVHFLEGGENSTRCSKSQNGAPRSASPCGQSIRESVAERFIPNGEVEEGNQPETGRFGNGLEIRYL